MRRPLVLLAAVATAGVLVRRRRAQQAEAELWTEATAAPGSGPTGIVRDLR